MAAATKRIDRTRTLIADLEKAASASVKEAAIMLKVIAREMVSRRYVKTTKQKQRDEGSRHWNAEQVAAERARGRAGFLARSSRSQQNKNASVYRGRTKIQQAGTTRWSNATR